MPLEIAGTVVAVCEAYAAAGVVFALLFLGTGLTRLDPGVAGAPKSLRLLLAPGIAAFWPLFAWRWATGAAEPIERNAHRVNARDAGGLLR